MNARFLMAAFAAGFLLTTNTLAVTVLGTGTGALIGGDLTDPNNNGSPDANVGYDAIFASDNEPGFGGGEFSFNVFDNQVGGGNARTLKAQEGLGPVGCRIEQGQGAHAAGG